MTRRGISVILLLIYTQASIQVSTPDSKYYTAAVLEYAPEYKKNDGPQTMEANTNEYIKYIKNAANMGVDIIVFPEYGLTSTETDDSHIEEWSSILPAASDNYVPCMENTIEVSETIKRLSCAARENKIYVAVNIVEKFPRCGNSTCSRDQTLYHNTNVVFDRTGKVIARYRKIHLYEEAALSPPEVPEAVTFDTDFGVKFGIMICFDILFYQPGLNLTRVVDVTDMIFSTAWFSEAPFLTANQVQLGWSFSENVNLLASGYNKPEVGSTGSGIYLGRKGIGNATFARTKKSEMLIYQVPKINKNSHKQASEKLTVIGSRAEQNTTGHGTEDQLLLIRDNNLSKFKTLDLNGSISEPLCDGQFCCEFNINLENLDPKTKYKVGVFAGRRLFGTSMVGGVTVCGVFQCENDTLASCGSIKSSETRFTMIEISTRYDSYNNNNNLILPSTVKSDLLPTSQIMLEEYKHDTHMHVTMTLSTPTKNLATFALYSRDFSEDGTNAGWRSQITVLLLIVTLGLSYVV